MKLWVKVSQKVRSDLWRKLNSSTQEKQTLRTMTGAIANIPSAHLERVFVAIILLSSQYYSDRKTLVTLAIIFQEPKDQILAIIVYSHLLILEIRNMRPKATRQFDS